MKKWIGIYEYMNIWIRIYDANGCKKKKSSVFLFAIYAIETCKKSADAHLFFHMII